MFKNLLVILLPGQTMKTLEEMKGWLNDETQTKRRKTISSFCFSVGQ